MWIVGELYCKSMKMLEKKAHVGGYEQCPQGADISEEALLESLLRTLHWGSAPYLCHNTSNLV